MKTRTIRDVAREELPRAVPSVFRRLVEESQLALADRVLVLVFQGDRSEPVLSRPVRRTLEREGLAPERRTGSRVVVGPTFTTEAEKMLADFGFEILTLTAFGWSDDSWKRAQGG